MTPSTAPGLDANTRSFSFYLYLFTAFLTVFTWSLPEHGLKVTLQADQMQYLHVSVPDQKLFWHHEPLHQVPDALCVYNFTVQETQMETNATHAWINMNFVINATVTDPTIHLGHFTELNLRWSVPYLQHGIVLHQKKTWTETSIANTQTVYFVFPLVYQRSYYLQLELLRPIEITYTVTLGDFASSRRCVHAQPQHLDYVWWAHKLIKNQPSGVFIDL